MADFGSLSLTTLGLALQQKVESGSILTFTKVAIGDGTISSDMDVKSLTDLIDPKITATINSVSASGTAVTLKFTFSNNGLTEGFYIRELGIFANDPDEGEILYAYSNALSPDYLPADGGSNIVEEIFEVIAAIGNASNVTATIDASLTFLPLTGGNMEGAINESQVTMASATTMNIGAADGNFILVTGTNTITAFDTAQAGTRRTLKFESALTITYKSKSMILPNSENLAVITGDVVEFISLGDGNWICTTTLKAENITNTPSGLITATTVQTAINQLYNFCFAWQPKASYAVGDICYSPNTNGYKRFECVFAGTSGAAEPSWTEIGTLITDGTVTWIVDDIRDGMRVGDIVLRYSLRDGYIKANGGQIKASDYPRLLKYVKDNNLSTTETLWQVGAYDKYVYDSSLDTLRIPNLVNRFLEGSDAESIIGAGLPNITGAFPVSAALASSYSSGAFYVSSSFSGNGQDPQPNFLIGFSAARANSIYGNSTTVQPAAIKLIAQVKY